MTRALPWSRLVAAAAFSPTALALGVAAPAAATEPELIEECTTRALDPEQIENGEHSEITCQWVDPEDEFLSGGGAFSMMSADITLAWHYSGHGGGGDKLTVYGPSCAGGVSFGSSDPWNDRISSTRHISCGGIKHYQHSNYSGAVQSSEGSYPLLVEMNQQLDDKVSSISYH